MTPEQEEAFVLRAKQCLASIDAFLKGLSAVPQDVRDAVEAFRETLPKEDDGK